MSAATPGCERIPAPISDTFAIPASYRMSVAPRSSRIGFSARFTRSMSLRPTVNEMSVCPAVETF